MNPSPRSSQARSVTGHDETPDTPGDLALAEYMLRIDRGEEVDRREFLRAHPEAAAELAEYFSGSMSLDRLVESVSLPFGPELAPALEPIRDLAARQAALDEETGEHLVGNEPTEVLLVDSAVDRAIAEEEAPPSATRSIAPQAKTPGWWGAALAACLVAGVAIYLGMNSLAPDTIAQDEGDNASEEESSRTFVVDDVKWEPAGPVVTLFDEVDRFAQLTPRKGLEITSKESFTGRKAIRIQEAVHCAAMPGLPAHIRERPVAGEYRYVKFAWKKEGGGPIALVFWGQAPNRRFHYFAGTRIGPTETVRSICLGDSPEEWTLVERDLFADFGPVNITAMTLITEADSPALFDSIRLTAKSSATFKPSTGKPREHAKHKQAGAAAATH